MKTQIRTVVMSLWKNSLVLQMKFFCYLYNNVFCVHGISKFNLELSKIQNGRAQKTYLRIDKKVQIIKN
jgi:hypothetical protein